MGLTSTWYWWLVAAAALFAFGFVFPIFVFPEAAESTETTSGDGGVFGVVLWMTWWGMWFVALVSAGIGLLLALLRLVVRHRSRPLRAT
jgi:hypothetical protein